MIKARWLAWPLAACLVAACEKPAPPPAPAAEAAARAILTLSPHLAELTYAAGAGEQLVGTVEFSDFPPEARRLVRVGDAFRVDQEAIAGLRPDLVLAWRSGNPPETVRRLQSLGYRLIVLEPERLDDIAAQLERIGELAGTQAVAQPAAAQLRERLRVLRQRYSGARPVRAFVQLSARPYFTVTDRHFIGQGLVVCGGENVFGGLAGLTPSISVEAIVQAAPDVIVASAVGGVAAAESELAAWRDWPTLPAARDRHLYAIDADLLSRPGPRIFDGIERLCEILDEARATARPDPSAARAAR
jgi:iron complex transport system substrate-binding protein